MLIGADPDQLPHRSAEPDDHHLSPRLGVPGDSVVLDSDGRDIEDDKTSLGSARDPWASREERLGRLLR
jgi:hypothetical protein